MHDHIADRSRRKPVAALRRTRKSRHACAGRLFANGRRPLNSVSLLLRLGRRFFDDFSSGVDRGVSRFSSGVDNFASGIDGAFDGFAGRVHRFAGRVHRTVDHFAGRVGRGVNRLARRFRRGVNRFGRLFDGGFSFRRVFFRTRRQPASGERNSQQNQPLLAHDPCTPAGAVREFGGGIARLLSDFVFSVKALGRLIVGNIAQLLLRFVLKTAGYKGLAKES
jgi:hypothetical protein